MLSQENTKNRDQDLGEKCRLALEKSYGFKIPMPKAVRKRHR